MNKNLELNIEINPEDLKLHDHVLFLKLYEQLKNEYNAPFNVLQEEITKAINVGKLRNICPVCNGFGMVNGLKCLGRGCLGRGYVL